MPRHRYNCTLIFALALAATVVWASPARAQTVVLSTFDPSEISGLCGIGFDAAGGTVWVYSCSNANIHSYTTDGIFIAAIPRPGVSANDVDLEVAPEALTLGTTAVPAGTLLVINGEAGTADIFAIDTDTGDVIASLDTEFGVSHVVGGAYHPIRDTFFLVQDSVPGVDDENRVAEIDPVSGSVLGTFQFTDSFSVYYGDIDVSASTGNLFLVSSDQSSIGEFTPAGDFVQVYDLPPDVTSLCGIALDCSEEEAWVSGTGGEVWRLGGVECGSSLVGASLVCVPETGTVPFTTQLTIVLENLNTGMTRRIAGHIDVTVAAGTHYTNWRSGYSNIDAGGNYTTAFPVTLPAVGTLIGDNHFVLEVEDVTPPPYNQPPFSPAGDTDTGSCTVTASGP
jgi:hypothetical protein